MTGDNDGIDGTRRARFDKLTRLISAATRIVRTFPLC